MNQKSNLEQWSKFLDPENLKDNLLYSSLFIAYFESFKDFVVEEIQFFFNTGFSNDEFTFSDDYKTKVLSKSKSPIKASLMFLVEMEAIDQNDIILYDNLRQYRNKLSHNLMQLLFEGLLEELPNKINDLNTLRYKIEKWWILNIQIPTSDDFTADNPPKEKDIITFSQIINQVILDLLSGDEIKANYYKQEFEKRFK